MTSKTTWMLVLLIAASATVARGGGAVAAADDKGAVRSQDEAALRALDLAWSEAASRKDLDAAVSYHPHWALPLCNTVVWDTHCGVGEIGRASCRERVFITV